MIKNFLVQQQINKLKAERDELSAKKNDLSLQIRDLGISKQAAWKFENGKSEALNNLTAEELQLFQKRKALAKEIMKAEKRFTELNTELRELYTKQDSEKNMQVMNIFKEIFSDGQRALIYEEIDRRMNGEEPRPIGLNIKDFEDYKLKYYSYRDRLRTELERMIEFRIRLTLLIEKGCEQFGDAEFLKFISPLNKLVLPLAELEKVKKQFLL